MTRAPALGAPAVGLVALLAVGSGCGGAAGPERPGAPVIAFLGDSITYGYTLGARVGHEPRIDPQGGYPGRLAARLGARAQVLNRGIGGATTGFWLAAPGSKVGQAMWTLVRHAPWFDPTLEPRGKSVALAVIAPARPDVVVVLLGVNDLHFARDRGESAARAAVDGLVRLARQLRPVAGRVLIATPLPNRRDPPALLRALGAGIRRTFPDALPVGERFAALDWATLLGDEVHPTAEGHARLADILERLLVERGVVAPAADRVRDTSPAPRLAATRTRAYQGPR